MCQTSCLNDFISPLFKLHKHVPLTDFFPDMYSILHWQQTWSWLTKHIFRLLVFLQYRFRKFQYVKIQLSLVKAQENKFKAHEFLTRNDIKKVSNGYNIM